jgi:anti-sigma B factor antagonist
MELAQRGSGAAHMEIEVGELESGISKAVLRGRFDTTGAVLVELPFNTLATERSAVIADLSAVSFLSSYGIRVLLVAAKILDRKGGRLVIVCPDNHVAKALHTAGIDSLIPLLRTEEAAVAALLAVEANAKPT